MFDVVIVDDNSEPPLVAHLCMTPLDVPVACQGRRGFGISLPALCSSCSAVSKTQTPATRSASSDGKGRTFPADDGGRGQALRAKAPGQEAAEGHPRYSPSQTAGSGDPWTGGIALRTDFPFRSWPRGKGYAKAQKNLQLPIGTPQSVLPKAKTLLRVLRPSIFVFCNIQGPVGDDDRKTSMRLIADELVPQLRAYAKEIDLVDPFERTPGSVASRNGVACAPVVDRGPLKDLSVAA